MYTNKDVAKMAGITPRLLIDLTEKGIVRATIDEGGKGSTRRYSKEDLFFVALYKSLAKLNLPYRHIKAIADYIDDEKTGFLIYTNTTIEIVPENKISNYVGESNIIIDLKSIAKKAVKMCKPKIKIKKR